MKFSASLVGGALLSLSCWWWSGCVPSGSGPLEEEKEPHFLAGKSRVNAMDYKGAIDSFEQALEVNPKSAVAHLELGVLFDQKESDPAAAIYHYECYLKLAPGGGKDEIVKTRILACKQGLARTVTVGPVTQTLQAELEKMLEENRRLAEDNKRLKDIVEAWRAYVSSHSPTPTPMPTNQTTTPMPARAGVGTSAPPASGVSASSASLASATRPVVAAPNPWRSHTVRSGETLASIARQYSIKLESLMAANPRLDARRLRPGQVLKIPSS